VTLLGTQEGSNLPWVSDFHRVIGRSGDVVTGYRMILVTS